MTKESRYEWCPQWSPTQCLRTGTRTSVIRRSKTASDKSGAMRQLYQVCKYYIYSKLIFTKVISPYTCIIDFYKVMEYGNHHIQCTCILNYFWTFMNVCTSLFFFGAETSFLCLILIKYSYIVYINRSLMETVQRVKNKTDVWKANNVIGQIFSRISTI